MVLALPELFHGHCEMFYQTAASAPGEWMRLKSSGSSTRFNIERVLFDGGMTFTQLAPKNVGSCSVKVVVEGSPLVVVKSEDLIGKTEIEIGVSCLSVLDPDFEYYEAGSKSLVQTLPLATASKQFKAIRLVRLTWRDFRGSLEQTIGHDHTRGDGVVLRKQLESLLVYSARHEGVMPLRFLTISQRIDALHGGLDDITEKEKELHEQRQKIWKELWELYQIVE